MFCSLTGKFYQVGDKKYCEADQEVSNDILQLPQTNLTLYLCSKISLDQCSVCGDYVRSGSVVVAGLTYHPECFACSECKLPIMDKFYTTDQGRWLCEEHYRLTLPRCYVCDLPVMERMLTAMDRQFHPSCFTCSVCSMVLDGKTFMAEGDTVHCRDCYAR